MNTKTPNLSSEMESDVSKTISGAEDMLAQAASSTGEKAAELRARALEQLKALRGRVQEAQELALRRSKEAARATDEYVHDNPWRAIGVAAGVGVLIGLLIGRR